MFGRNKSNKETARDCSNKSDTYVESGFDMNKKSSKKNSGRGNSSKHSSRG